jgi:hypothetical protein
MSGIAPKQYTFKFKIAPNKQKSIAKELIWHVDVPPPPHPTPWPTGPCAYAREAQW